MRKIRRLKALAIRCESCNRSWDRETFENGGLFHGSPTTDDREVERRMRSWLAGHQRVTGHFAKIEREEIPY